MSRLILITGGIRSGKSRQAEQLLAGSADVLYIATARCFDEEMERRIAVHRASRPAKWITAEQYRDLDRLLQRHPDRDVLLDCVSNMVTNLMLDAESDYDHISMERAESVEQDIRRQFGRFLEELRRRQHTAVLVTNECGSGLVAPYRLGRIFADIMGRLNQYLAGFCDEVYLMSCGLPLQLK
ncbi:MAG: bifunctional adenosylcobinamide kinase/adenosylcobinamide-phosphate guanylyltransferase [Clostridiales bacterium]|jgi:adenosylcobinamide kinase/adenosylcobinamide-phosphate guanylyltransferase|nr:bifunctional adenosylcobinamide kinase/adenosylcobinamide-phosphate guanylyltransferase [Clostridiales bacterium]